ncbi:major facilitator superfamily domain-containing protein [Hypomontagnella submonticulosa]|nr:major facilitator superfamily domain-containing protein [Hypomontagnella submonticulosa]
MGSAGSVENVDNPTTDTESNEPPNRYLSGARLFLAILGLGIAVFLPTAEASIISTSLVTISKDLDAYDQSSWVITAYLLTYTGFLVIWSKLTGMMGLRPAVLLSTVIFMAFSGACGAARSMTQLIVFRAIQGIGGSGLYSVPTIGMFQLVPGSRYSQINGIAASVMAISLLIGPLIGGAISQTGDWRWIFYFNVPAGAVSAGLVLTVIPSRFPRHCEPPDEKRGAVLSSSIGFLNRADVPGAFLLLGASILLVAALEEGGVHFAWNSAAIIVFFVLSGVLWIVFGLWEWYASREGYKVEPMFPRRFFSNRVFLGVLLGCFISGVPLIVAVIEIPQRYQLVNAATPIQAGARLLSYAAMLPFGIVLSNALTGKFQVPFVYTLILGAALQTVGFALLSTLPTTVETWTGQYGYSVISGLGIGISIGTFYVIGPIAVDKKDQHLAVGAGMQSRLLGSAVGIAIVNSVLNGYLREHLSLVLDPSLLEQLLQSAANLETFDSNVQFKVRAAYGEAFNLQMRATVAFCAAQFLIVPLLWKKKPLRLSKNGTLE